MSTTEYHQVSFSFLSLWDIQPLVFGHVKSELPLMDINLKLNQSLAFLPIISWLSLLQHILQTQQIVDQRLCGHVGVPTPPHLRSYLGTGNCQFRSFIPHYQESELGLPSQVFARFHGSCTRFLAHLIDHHPPLDSGCLFQCNSTILALPVLTTAHPTLCTYEVYSLLPSQGDSWIPP